MGVALEVSPIDWLEQQMAVDYFDDGLDEYPYEFPGDLEAADGNFTPP